MHLTVVRLYRRYETNEWSNVISIKATKIKYRIVGWGHAGSRLVINHIVRENGYEHHSQRERYIGNYK
jgi:hypothetical protein